MEKGRLYSLIELHYEDDSEVPTEYKANPLAVGWRVGTVIQTDSEGNKIMINCGNAAALGSLLTKLSECHA